MFAHKQVFQSKTLVSGLLLDVCQTYTLKPGNAIVCILQFTLSEPVGGQRADIFRNFDPEKVDAGQLAINNKRTLPINCLTKTNL